MNLPEHDILPKKNFFPTAVFQTAKNSQEKNPSVEYLTTLKRNSFHETKYMKKSKKQRSLLATFTNQIISFMLEKTEQKEKSERNK